LALTSSFKKWKHMSIGENLWSWSVHPDHDVFLENNGQAM
jgi:hypothetical protein